MENNNARLEAFSDGVFAIAITLLIIEIKIPSIESVHNRHELWMAFAHAWPSWFAFLLSFITILITWVNHWHALKLIHKSSSKFTYANGLLLLSIVIIPFPTAAVAEYLDSDNSDLAQPAITLYCAVALLTNIAWLLMQYTILHPESLLNPNVNINKVKKINIYSRGGFALYSFAFILSFWFPIAAFMIIALSFLMWLVLGISLKEERMTN